MELLQPGYLVIAGQAVPEEGGVAGGGWGG